MLARRFRGPIICWSVVTALASVVTGGTVLAAPPAMHLDVVEELPGPILDVAQDRILYVDHSDQTPRVTIKNRADGSETVLGDGPAATGFLSPGGAIYVEKAPIYGTVIQYTDGARTELGEANSALSLRVAGRWAIWNTAPTFPTPLVVRDLISGQQRVVAEDAGNWQNDVAENGDIVYWDRTYNVNRDRGGQLEVLSAADQATWVTYPRTDGINAIYRRHSPCCLETHGGIWLTTESGEIDLDAFRNEWPSADFDYAVNDGWAAFTRPKTGGGFTVWSRDPDGLMEPRDIDMNAAIAAIGESGEILIRERTEGQRFFLSRPGEETIPLGSVEGQPSAFWAIGPDWYIASRIGSSPEAPPRSVLYIVAAGAAPTPTPSESPTAPAPTPTPGDPSSIPVDITPPPTDGVRPTGRSTPPVAILVLVGLVGLTLLAAASRARARSK